MFLLKCLANTTCFIVQKLFVSGNFLCYSVLGFCFCGYVKLQLDLSSINSPSGYGILFYTAESFKSNEVRDFSSWVAIPPSTMKVSTSPTNIIVRQGDQQLIPADISSIYSNNVTSITFNNIGSNNNSSSDFTSSGLHASIQRIQPPLFKVQRHSKKISACLFTVLIHSLLRHTSTY